MYWENQLYIHFLGAFHSLKLERNTIHWNRITNFLPKRAHKSGYSYVAYTTYKMQFLQAANVQKNMQR